MKYLVSWTIRNGGSAEEQDAAGRKLLETFGKWSPPADQDFQQFLGRIDGQGGYAVIETDNAAGLQDAPSKFAPWLDFTIVPVVDIMDSVAVIAEGAAFRDSVG